MKFTPWNTTLDETTRGILFGFGGLILLAIFFYLIGWVGKLLGFIGRVIQGSIDWGFRVWERTLWWTGWFSYLVLVSLVLGLGIRSAQMPGALWGICSMLCALLLLGMGAVTCLAFMCISLERYEVSRGHKAVHNPAKGQELAHHFARYGLRFGPVMLGVAAVATVAAFALLNQSIYDIINPSWYIVRDSQPHYLDFLAFTLINLVRVVDILDLLRSGHLINISIVRQNAAPVTALLVVFKSFFTLVLVQQIMAAIREQKILWEMISDFWSTHPPIHERARGALSQFGPLVIAPVMQSLGKEELLTREQRDELPKVLADIGSPAIPMLRKYLKDERDVVRGVATVALGDLKAVELAPELARRCQDDSNENVRAYAAEALGVIGEAYASRESNSCLPAQANPRRGKWVTVVIYSGKLPIHAARFFWNSWQSLFRPDWKAQSELAGDPLRCCIEPLRYALMDTSAGVRAQATIALGRLGSCAAVATADLIRLMQSGTEQERCLTIEALGKLQSFPETVVPTLVQMIGDPAASVRVSAATALGAYREQAKEAVSALVSLLDDPLDTVRSAATAAIQQIGTLDEDSTRTLAENLSHPDNLRRAQTAESLGEMGEAAESTASALVDSLDDENDLVRSKAAEALGRIGEVAAEHAVPALIKALEDPDNHVKARAAEALGQMGENAGEAVPHLVQVLQNSNPQVRACSAEALGQLRAEAARNDLEHACRDEDAAVQVQAIISLGKLGCATPTTKETLLDLLHSADPLVRGSAAETLALCGADDRTVLEVAALLDDSSEEVTMRVMKALPRFDGPTLPSVIEILTRRLTDELSAQVSLAAARALGQMGQTAVSAGPGLALAAQTGDVQLRRSSLHALAMLVPPEALPAFLAALPDADSSVRVMASAGLIKVAAIPEENLADLLETLRDPELRVRANIVQVLARLKSLPADAETPLIQCAGLALTGLRRQVAVALRKFDSADCRAALQNLLIDPNQKVRNAAAESLKILEPESTIETVENTTLPPEESAAVVANPAAPVESIAV